MDTLYRVATGVLGWPPETAWHTPIPQLLLSLAGRMEWENRYANPTPSAPSKQAVADKLRAFFRGRGAA